MSWDRVVDGVVRATTRTFARSAGILYNSAGVSPDDLSGRAIFTEAHQAEVLDENEASVQTLAPTLDLRLVDVSTPPAEDMLVVVGAQTFKIASVELDSEGGALCILEDVA